MTDQIQVVQCLRNFRARCASEDPIDIEEVDKVLSFVRSISFQQLEGDTLLLLRLLAQCLSNLVVSQSKLNEELWNWCQQLLPSFLNVKDFAFINYLSAYLNSTFVRSSVLCSSFINDSCLAQFVTIAYENALKGGEYSQFLLETLIKKKHFKTMYNTRNTDQRVYFLNMLEGMIENDLQDLIFILSLFKTQASQILNSKEKVEPSEFTSILSLIAKISTSREKYLKLCSDKSLSIDCMYVLRAIHESPRSQELEIKTLLSSNETRPQLNIKGNLITIISNLSYKNKDIQDLARDTGIIPIILECTNIDADNPFIREKSIVCIKCLCEGNIENQEFVSKIDKVTATTAEAKLLAAERIVEHK